MSASLSSSALKLPLPQVPPGRPPAPTRLRQHLHAVPPLSNTPGPDLAPADELAIPPPDHRVIRMLAVYGFEVLDGSRSVAQLGAWITREVADHLIARRAARTERRTLYRDGRRTVPVPGPVHLSPSTPTAAEVSIVLQTGERYTAVAMRLEYLREKWRATELIVL